ncbi:hypothetical protein C0993_003951 [Termitomyces sp. T159_Od127]|nr:hypothetical protein C0993_003951 [Termitomyces sp. T159_Od127]
MSPYINRPVPDAYQYFPLNEPPIGSYMGHAKVNTEDKTIPALFRPLSMRGMDFKNRIFVAPMCQYSAVNGHATDWHFVHVGGFATGGAGAICMEATAVVPEGRVAPEDVGLWADSQVEPLRRIVDFCHAQGTKIGIQLAHAGRKASVHAPWIQRRASRGTPNTAAADENGWPDNVLGPSDLSFSKTYPSPKAMTKQDMDVVVQAFVSAVERCKSAGFDFIEIHAAHGYLLHSFVSPLSNVRNDQYGGQPLENRLRFPLRVIKACRDAWEKPLWVRISAYDWAEGPEQDELGTWKQWGIEQSKIYVGEMQKMGIDLVDASSGGNWVDQEIPLKHGYQVHFAEALKQAHPSLVISTVGLITDPLEANSYIESGKADVISLARVLLRTPHWPLLAANELGVTVKPANQYERAWY